MVNAQLAKKVKELRSRRGFSQEILADNSGLSLRTIQRIELGTTVPRGDTLQRLASALEVSPDDLIDWKIVQDKNILTLLSLSQLGFLVFPLLGIIFPTVIWVLKKEKVKDVDALGKAILNFQISWTLTLGIVYILAPLKRLTHGNFGLSIYETACVFGVLYLLNLIAIVLITIKTFNNKQIYYIPAVRFLQ